MAEEDEKAEETAGESGEETEETANQEGAPEGEEAPPKEKKKKKVVRRRKTKKERENPLTMAVRLAVESGKVEFGARAGASAGDTAKLFVVASNTPKEARDKIESISKGSKVPLIEFEGSTMELGSVCGKPFPVSVLTVYEEGASNILELAKKK